MWLKLNLELNVFVFMHLIYKLSCFKNARDHIDWLNDNNGHFKYTNNSSANYAKIE